MPSTFTTGLSLEKQATGENDNTWGTLLNAVLDQIDRALAQRVTIAVTAADVTLTATQSEYLSIKLNDTLTGNRNVIFPAIAKAWLVENATSGAFTLTCKTAAGTGIVIPQGQKMLIMGDGTNIINAIDSLILSDIRDASANQLMALASTGVSTLVMAKWAKGADVASAAALSLGDDGNYFDVTGTTTITSIDTKGVGTPVRLHFDAALTLTHHATDLILPGAANITTAAGDEAEFVEYAAGDWRCTKYQRASHLASGWEVISTGTVSAAASLDITDLSADYRAYKLVFNDLLPATDGVDLYLRTDTNNGASFEAGASDYSFAAMSFRVGGAAPVGDALNSSSAIVLTSTTNAQAGNVADAEEVSGEITIYNPMDASDQSRTTSHLSFQNSGSNYAVVTGSGVRNASEANNAFQLLFSSGNIATMEYTLYGLRAAQ